MLAAFHRLFKVGWLAAYVEDAEDDYKEQCAQLIAETAAELVAARDMSRSDAIKAATEWVRRENEAEGDLTQVASIKNELLPEPRSLS